MRVADWLDRVVGRIERAESLDKPAAAIMKISERIPGTQLLDDVASGTVIGHPLHPLLVTVPIGAWTSAVVFDVLGEEDAARTLTGFGVLAAIPTMITGHEDWRYIAGGEQRVGSVHAALNNVAVWSYAGSWLARRAGRRGLGIVLAAVGGGALGFSGYLGGHLSYALGVGVDTTAFQHSVEEWTDIVGLDELTVGALHAGEAGGVPVVLLRRGPAEVAVLAGRCTHRGGPLAEGSVEDGCIVCPWHGAAFAPDGSVVHGPASRPQPAYEVKIEGGRVLVRRSDEPRTFRSNPVGV